MTRSLLFALFFLSAGCSSFPKELPVVARPPETGATTAQSQKKRKPVVLTKKHILKRLGEPKVTRKESPAEVWVYAENSCVLYIYLQGSQTQEPRVAHMEIGAPALADIPQDSTACLNMATRL